MSKLKNFSSNRAITLIALIITIIVMLILVGVSVSIVVESDLIGAVEKATNAYKNAQDKEGSMGEITIGGVRYDNMDDYLNNRPWTPIRIRTTVEYNEEPVTAGGNVSTIKEGAPIPTGFYYVGGTLNTGVVISDDPDDENKGDGHNVALEGNQFVWVPVQREQTIKITVKSEKEITGIRIGGPTGEITTDTEGNAFNPSGTNYEVEINPTINGIYVIHVQAGEDEELEEEIEIVQISSLYSQNFYELNSDLIDAIVQVKAMAVQNGMTIDELLATEAIQAQYPGLTSIVQAPLFAYIGYGFSNYSDATITTYAGSVNKYGGFYIARYEAGSETARTSSSASLTTVYSKKNMYPYNYVTQTQAIELSQGVDAGKTSVTSDLVNAAAWDRTLNWLIETKAVTEEQVATDSTSWGNYSNSSLKFTGKYTTSSTNWPENEGTNMTKPTYESSYNNYLLGTGVSNYTRRNNIYDLAGNCTEWTTEATSSSDVVYRGGAWHFNDPFPAGFRHSTSVTTDYNYCIAFRPVLYINQ